MKRFRVLLIILLCIHSLDNFCQNRKKLFYGFKGEIVSSKDSALILREIEYDSTINRYKFWDYELRHSHRYLGYGELLSIIPEIKDGKFEYTDLYSNSITALYKNDSLVKITSSISPDGEVQEPIYYAKDITEPPTFQGESLGDIKVMKKIMTHIKDQVLLSEGELNHQFLFRFIIDKEGNISRLESLRTPPTDPILSKLHTYFLKVISELTFTPGKHREKPVNVGVFMPIKI